MYVTHQHIQVGAGFLDPAIDAYYILIAHAPDSHLNNAIKTPGTHTSPPEVYVFVGGNPPAGHAASRSANGLRVRRL